MRVGKHIRKPEVLLENLLENFDHLRFIMPVRYPLDIMRSTIEKGYYRLYPSLNNTSSEQETLDAILKEMQWFCQLKKQFPNFFFYFFEHQFDRKKMIEMALFLNVDLDEQWLNDSLEIFNVSTPYEHAPDIKAYFTKQIDNLFAEFPDFKLKLHYFLKK